MLTNSPIEGEPHIPEIPKSETNKKQETIKGQDSEATDKIAGQGNILIEKGSRKSIIQGNLYALPPHEEEGHKLPDANFSANVAKNVARNRGKPLPPIPNKDMLKTSPAKKPLPNIPTPQTRESRPPDRPPPLPPLPSPTTASKLPPLPQVPQETSSSPSQITLPDLKERKKISQEAPPISTSIGKLPAKQLMTVKSKEQTANLAKRTITMQMQQTATRTVTRVFGKAQPKRKESEFDPKQIRANINNMKTAIIKDSEETVLNTYNSLKDATEELKLKKNIGKKVLGFENGKFVAVAKNKISGTAQKETIQRASAVILAMAEKKLSRDSVELTNLKERLYNQNKNYFSKNPENREILDRELGHSLISLTFEDPVVNAKKFEKLSELSEQLGEFLKNFENETLSTDEGLSYNTKTLNDSLIHLKSFRQDVENASRFEDVKISKFSINANLLRDFSLSMVEELSIKITEYGENSIVPEEERREMMRNAVEAKSAFAQLKKEVRANQGANAQPLDINKMIETLGKLLKVEANFKQKIETLTILEQVEKLSTKIEEYTKNSIVPEEERKKMMENAKEAERAYIQLKNDLNQGANSSPLDIKKLRETLGNFTNMEANFKQRIETLIQEREKKSNV